MLYRRPRSAYWYVRFELDGREFRFSTRTRDRAQAEEFETQARNRAWRQVRLGERAVGTWEQACKRWLKDTQKRTVEKDRIIIAWFDGHLKGQPLTNVTTEVIEELRGLKADETSKSTADRYMALLRAILKRELKEAAPKVPMYRPKRKEPRWLTRAQADKLLKKLEPNPHLADLVRFTLATGQRMRNVTHLTWDRVDLKRRHMWIPGSSAKGKEAIAVPLNDDAVEVLKRWQGKHESRVFVFRGQPVDDANGAAFKKAVKAAGLAPLRWHDLRHTWASWHVQQGTPLHALQELGAWSSYEMVLTYAHLSSSHLARYAKAVQRKK